MHPSLEQPLHWAWAEESDFTAFRGALRDIGYSPERVATELGLPKVDDLYPLDYRLLPALVERLEQQPGHLAVAITSLLLGLPVPADKLREALKPDSVDLLQRCGLAVETSGTIHAFLSVVPFENVLVVADKLFMNADPDHIPEGLSSENAVWRLDKTTRIMARALPGATWTNALELCCGSGVLSFLAGQHAKDVTGTDINPRAVNVAQFNARLNGSANSRFLVSDLDAALDDARFGLVLMNPPSAPGLVRSWNREGGSSGREVVEAGIAAARQRLADRGLFLTSLHLGYQSDQDIHDWAELHFPRGEYKVAVVRHGESWSAEEYALNEALRKSGPRDFETYRRTYRMYRSGLERHGIGRVAFAVLAARRGGSGVAFNTADLYGTGWEQDIAVLAR
ncbi:MAG TPA: methyltransferase [Candidatus Edwardsbacteria bacterium]|nr:methyltransferase [Candidatus Edwardsbacteria bacterium]